MSVTTNPKRLGEGLPDEAFWAEDWPHLERKLTRIVARRLPQGFDAQDVTQHVALVLVARPGEFYSREAIARYATTTACNYVKRQYRLRALSRRIAHMTVPGESRGVEDTVLQRLRADCLRELLAGLREVDLYAVQEPTGKPELLDPKIRTRRSRVRASLRDKLDKRLGGLVIVPRLRWLLGPTAVGTAAIPAVMLFGGPTVLPSAPAPTVAGDAGELLHQPALLPPLVESKQQPARSGSPQTEPTPEPAIDTAYRPLVGLRGPHGAGAEAGTRDPSPEEGPQPLLCLSGTDPLPPPCLEHPLGQ